MRDSKKFMHLKEIAQELNRKLDLLLNGSLSKSELEQLTEESRELYERLVVIRYRAYDEEVKGVEVEKSVEPEVTEMPAIHFKIEEPKEEVKIEAPVQVSLIDAIEEVTKAEVNKENEIVESPVLNIEAEVIQEPAITPTAAANPLQAYMNTNKESLHDKLTKSLGTTETLAERLEHNPISDLKKAITLNQRFQFSKELFKGDNQSYEIAIDKLNTISRDEAMKHLESLRKEFSWNSESPVTNDFVELVGRRHQ